MNGGLLRTTEIATKAMQDALDTLMDYLKETGVQPCPENTKYILAGGAAQEKRGVEQYVAGQKLERALECHVKILGIPIHEDGGGGYVSKITGAYMEETSAPRETHIAEAWQSWHPCLHRGLVMVRYALTSPRHNTASSKGCTGSVFILEGKAGRDRRCCYTRSGQQLSELHRERLLGMVEVLLAVVPWDDVQV